MPSIFMIKHSRAAMRAIFIAQLNLVLNDEMFDKPLLLYAGLDVICDYIVI